MPKILWKVRQAPRTWVEREVVVSAEFKERVDEAVERIEASLESLLQKRCPAKLTVCSASQRDAAMQQLRQ